MKANIRSAAIIAEDTGTANDLSNTNALRALGFELRFGFCALWVPRRIENFGASSIMTIILIG